MLKDRDYDVTPYIILILSLTLTQNARGGRSRSGRCSVKMVVEECEVYWSSKSGRLGETSVVVSSVTRTIQW